MERTWHCVVMMVVFVLLPLSVLSAPHKSFADKPTSSTRQAHHDEPSAMPSTMPTDMRWKWSHYSKLVSGQADAFARMAGKLPIPSTFAEIRDVASTQASCWTEATVSSTRALHDALPVSEVHSMLQTAIDQGKAGAGVLYEALPAAEDVQSVASTTLSELRAGKTDSIVRVVQQKHSTASEMCARLYDTLPATDTVQYRVKNTIVRGGEVVDQLYEAIPATNAIQSRMLSGLEQMRITIPLPSPDGGGNYNGDGFGESDDDRGGHDGGGGGDRNNQEGGNTNDSQLICPFTSKSEFDTAFDEELRAVTGAQDCVVLKLASQKLLKRFGYHRLDAQQAACTNLPHRLDEYNGIATRKTAILCAQRGQ